MFIDQTYFKNDIAIIFPDGTYDFAQNDYLQKRYLIDALGYDLYKAFIVGLEESVPLAKWTNLRDGAEYQVENVNGDLVTVKWNGLINDDKVSLLAYFMYYDLCKSATYNSQFAEFYPVDENAEQSRGGALRQKLSNAYNSGLDLYGKDIQGIMPYNVGRPVIQCNPDYGTDILESTLYNFIYFANEADPTTYPNWQFKLLGDKSRMNSLGI